MRKPVIWVERDENRVKTEIRVSFMGGRPPRWQSKRAGSEEWVYDFEPTPDQWIFLASKIEDRYRRRAATWEDVLRIRELRDRMTGSPVAGEEASP